MENSLEEITQTKQGKSQLGLILRGLSMGVAEVIPGVSGGTLAFITGIYEDLLLSIKSVDLTSGKLLLTGQFREAWQRINGPFLIWLAIGMFIGVVCGVFGVTYLLEKYPEVLWSLFFGCILASIPYMLSQVSKFSLPAILGFVLAASVAGYLCLLQPIQSEPSLIYIFVAGTVAISALILPGVSGSFILVLLGLYTTVIPSIKAFLSTFAMEYFTLLFVFGMGCLVGLAVFSRFLTYIYQHYRDVTLATLSGFMLGSLVKIWPWRNPEAVLDKSTGQVRDIAQSELTRSLFHNDDLKIISEQFVSPSNYFSDPYTIYCIMGMLVGAAAVYGLAKSEKG